MKLMMGLAIWSAAALSAAGVWAQALPTAEPDTVGMSSERLDRIGTAFEAEVGRGELPGAVIMVARDGQLVYTAAVGELAPEADTAMVDDAIFRIYSMTKPLTSVAALILMEEGKLQLSDPVHKFLPEFEGLEVSAGDDAGQGAEPTDRPMTVQDLLRHTSGLAYGELTQNEAVKAAYAEASAFNPDGMAFDARGVSGDEQVAGLGRAPLARQPGTQWEYRRAGPGRRKGLWPATWRFPRGARVRPPPDAGQRLPRARKRRDAACRTLRYRSGKPRALADDRREPAARQ